MPKNNSLNSLSRRGAMKAGVIAASAASVGLTATTQSVMATESRNSKVPKTILFQGDSITDAGRDRKNQRPNDARGLGRGYPFLVASSLLRDAPAAGYKIHNRGISGNKVPDLQKRWQADCIDLKPDVLSILIGVNDIWHKLNGRYNGTVADYESGYRKLLSDTQAALPDTTIVICEPFVLKCGAVNDKWFPEFDERREAAVKLATEFGLTLVPFQQMFDKAITDAEPSYWAGDGVHPSVAGHALMAKTWIDTVGL